MVRHLVLMVMKLLVVLRRPFIVMRHLRRAIRWTTSRRTLFHILAEPKFQKHVAPVVRIEFRCMDWDGWNKVVRSAANAASRGYIGTIFRIVR